jgi:sporulation protein YlmC with PRC-barrel domain
MTTVDLHLQLLDRQVVDRDGELVCKVDDLELQPGADGVPVVTAILVGPRALGPRFGGRLGRWVTALASRLAAAPGSDPPRIPFAAVTDVHSAVDLDRTRDELGVDPLEGWVDQHLIARLPGSRHAGG